MITEGRYTIRRLQLFTISSKALTQKRFFFVFFFFINYDSDKMPYSVRIIVFDP